MNEQTTPTAKYGDAAETGKLLRIDRKMDGASRIKGNPGKPVRGWERLEDLRFTFQQDTYPKYTSIVARQWFVC